MKKELSIIWKKTGMSGTLELINAGTLSINEFTLRRNRVDFYLVDGMLDPGAYGSIITVRTENPFSFFARDVKKSAPIFIREYEVVVTEGSDRRTYDEIVSDILSTGRTREIDRLDNAPEESFETAAAKSRSMRVPTWLGLGRDVRMFEVTPHQVVSDGQVWDTIAPKYHHTGEKIKEGGDLWLEYDYFAGRGIGHKYKMKRWLERKTLPILNACSDDDGIKYYHKIFVTLENTPLTEETNKGTDFLVADMYAVGSMRTPEQQAKADKMHDSEIYRDEETVCYLRIEAVNESNSPKYCFVRLPYPNAFSYPYSIPSPKAHPVINEPGYLTLAQTQKVFLVSTLNGKPFSEVDSSVLLAPGEKATYICKIPHSPIPKERAEELMKTDFDEKLNECIQFWQGKLDRIAQISLPDKRIEEMMKAGFLHFDLSFFGSNPDGPVSPVVGVYGPIGTESAPIISYVEAMGDQKLAERAIRYFTEKQRDDGFIQNFGGYMSETGPALWFMSEHFKYTHDIEYLKSIKDNIIRACDYVKKWMDQYRDESLRGHGYGMIAGKVADCDTPYQSFMLNATTYGGLKSSAEVLAYIDEKESERIGAIAEDLRNNILESLDENFAVSPVVPLSDGSWCPSVSLWPNAGNYGPLCLFANGGMANTHGSMVIQDGLLGGEMYLVTNGVLPADHTYVKFISNVFAELLAVDNVGYSQPYYNQEPYGNILRGEVGAYISEFYGLMSALADRETYTFWEHLFQCSPHKTHEEGWFMMRCRWMLFMDEHGKFDLLGAVPRAWLKQGDVISYNGMTTRYGKLSVKVVSEVDTKRKISADIQLVSNGFECPREITIRLPHPDKLKAVSCKIGRYNADSEKITIRNFKGKAHVELDF